MTTRAFNIGRDKSVSTRFDTSFLLSARGLVVACLALTVCHQAAGAEPVESAAKTKPPCATTNLESWEKLEELAEKSFVDGNLKQARAYWESALSVAETKGQELNVATTLNLLNHLYMKTKEYEKAHRALIRALSIRKRRLGENHLLTGETMGNLGLISHKLGHDREAEDWFRQSLAIKDKQLGTDSPASAVTLHNLANLLSHHRKYREAKDLLERVLKIDSTKLGSDHVEVMRDLTSLGINAYRCTRYDEALSYLKRAMKISPASSDARDRELVNIYHYLGLSLARKGDHRQAGEYYKKARDLGHLVHGKHHPANTVALINLARSADELGETERAEKLLLEALEHEDNRPSCNPYLTTDVNVELGHYYQRHDMTDEALRCYKRALETYARLSAPQMRKLYELPVAMSDILKKLGRDQEAEAISQKYLHIHTPHHSDAHFRIGSDK